jgi:citrate synthase
MILLFMHKHMEKKMTTHDDQWIAAETVLSDVDGDAGRLILRGFDLQALAGKRSYEDVVTLLWKDVVTNGGNGTPGLQQRLGLARVAAFAQLQPMLAHIPGSNTADVMRALMALPQSDASLLDPVGQLALAAVAAAMATCKTSARAATAPDSSLSHSADLLTMLRGDLPSTREIEAFETYLVSAIDHGLNASTFTARVVASTAATLQSSLVAAFAALTGPLHGGAPGPVLDMLDAVGSADAARPWVDQQLAEGHRLMGFGHRIYRVRDPRADVLKAALEKLASRSERMALAEAVEQAALSALNSGTRTRRLDTNTEFYTALLLEALRIPRQSFTPIFAAARCAGWIAHVAEQQNVGRLIRPQSRYVGDKPRVAA